jgi:hypothetical protein
MPIGRSGRPGRWGVSAFRMRGHETAARLPSKKRWELRTNPSSKLKEARSSPGKIGGSACRSTLLACSWSSAGRKRASTASASRPPVGEKAASVHVAQITDGEKRAAILLTSRDRAGSGLSRLDRHRPPPAGYQCCRAMGCGREEVS